ncbi:MAG: replication-associated recombination protein A, partial [Desulfobacterales bacterium]
LSRCRVITLHRLTEEDISAIIDMALSDEQRGLGGLNIELAADARDYIVRIADGDARVALNSLEVAGSLVISRQTPDSPTTAGDITLKDLEIAIQKKALVYDKGGEEHYNLISALHKSLRGSDPDAALYWLARMLAGGEDPFYIARRMVRFASEDIGNADPNALSITMNAMEAFKFLGHPEGELALAQAVVYLATAPKSNSIYSAFGKAKAAIKKTGSLPVPFHIRNAPTKLMKDLGYGKNYKYAHNYENAIVPQEYLPDELKGQFFYFPTNRGFEKIIKDRLDKWRQLIRKSKTKKDQGD